MPEHPSSKLYTGTAINPPAEVAPSAFGYAELDVTTNFSFLRGASHPDELVYTAATLGCRAMAVTDINTLAGVVRAWEAARKVKGFQLIVGARLVFNDGSPDLLAWPADRDVYARLSRLLTLGRRRAPKGECHLSLGDFLDYSDGLLAAIAPAWPRAPDEAACHRLREAMGDRLSLAVSLCHGDDDAALLAGAVELAGRTGVPLLATNHVHYHDPGRRALQDVLTCVRHGCTIHEAGFRLFPNAERHLKPPEQMVRLFADYPRAIDRGLEVAARCRFTLDELQYDYPTEVVPPGRSPSDYLRELTYAGAAERYPQGVSAKVRALLEKELKFICHSKYESYFLTVYDLVRYARSRGILCQGRGSAANSAVCYCLGVTAVDPDKFQLVFERFASGARGEPPDIDVDFEHERREEVIQYVYQKYGRDRAGMTASLITYRGRSAVRDVGKALGFSRDMVEQLANRLDWWHTGTLSPAQLRELGLDPSDRAIYQLVWLTGQLLGFPRHLSQHVGGMVISRRPLHDIVPIENAAMADRTVIEWDKDDLDSLGIFKVDLLALGMLTCISKGLAMINSYARAPGEPPLEMHTIPAEDSGVYDMIDDADTIGVFQIESRAQMSMLPRLRPREFYDLVIEVAIVRPGPIQGDMVHPYLQRREAKRADPNYQIEYPKDELRGVLGKTLGVPLFQEQAMQLAMVAAGFSGAEADELRRAMAAWRRSGRIEKLHDRFVNGMTGRGYEPDFAERCFKQICGFGEYGFPESHAASFAKLVYVSAWIKRYHPAAFAAALLNSQPMGFYAPAQIVRDAREHGVEVRPVDVNFSDWDCTLEGEGEDCGLRIADCGLNATAANGDIPDFTKDSRSAAIAACGHLGDDGQIRNVPFYGCSDSRQAAHPLSPVHRGEGGGEGLRASGAGLCAAFPAYTAPHPNPLAGSRRIRSLLPWVQGRGDQTRAPVVGTERYALPTGPKSTWDALGPAIRLGFRQIKGLRQEGAERIVAARREHGSFASVDQLQHRAGVEAGLVRRLAQADALNSIRLNRRNATWEAMALSNSPAPLFDGLATPIPATVAAPLPPMPPREEVLADYASTGLSIKRHPVSFARSALDRWKIATAAEVQQDAGRYPNGRLVSVAGLVLVRQRPGTASGVVFITLEDETGVVNLILWASIYERYRVAARYATLLQANGIVQREGQVVHVLAKRLIDRTPLLGGLAQSSRDFH